MAGKKNLSASSFRYHVVLYILLILYCSVLAFLAYPKAKEYLTDYGFSEHYRLWKTKSENLQAMKMTVLLESFSGEVEVERTVSMSKKDQLHCLLEALLEPISEEELKKGCITLIPPQTKLLGIAQSEGYFFVRLSDDFLEAEDLEGALRQMKKTLGLHYDTESLTVICGQGDGEERFTIS